MALHAATETDADILNFLYLLVVGCRVGTPKEFMKYVEAAQRRRDPEKRHQTSAVFVIDVTQVRSRSADSVVLTCSTIRTGRLLRRVGTSRALRSSGVSGHGLFGRGAW